ncbi:hypothetical protein EVAR_84025_1 [Eumeta japonica]|uniref:Uncharacterized protein n=1 Tax=Eumeta variegata TaxID=151549 RepID=A0A4C1X714_EUMVA|nr:hypothetical protein EVAR_84025_1 [Eumeta japonica]
MNERRLKNKSVQQMCVIQRSANVALKILKIDGCQRRKRDVQIVPYGNHSLCPPFQKMGLYRVGRQMKVEKLYGGDCFETINVCGETDGKLDDFCKLKIRMTEYSVRVSE